MSVNEKMTAIADAIRNKTGGTDKLSLDEIAQEVPQIYDEGKQAQLDEFWEDYMKNLNSAWSHKQAFSGKGWNDKTFNPTASFKPWYTPVCERFFRESAITDLKEILERNGVTFDFSGCPYFAEFAFQSNITRFPLIDMSSCTSSSSAFHDCSKMVELTLKTSSTTVFGTNFFYGCTSLSDLTIGAHKKGKTCSELITLPFNEVFATVTTNWFAIEPSFAEKYSEYFSEGEETGLDGVEDYYTYIALETGEQFKCGTFFDEIQVPSDTWWIPANGSENVSFYLCKNEEDLFTQESISQSISLANCPLNQKSIACIFSALSSTANGKTLTLKKSAVNEAFGIDVDDESTWVTDYGDYSSYHILRHSKDNWTISYV